MRTESNSSVNTYKTCPAKYRYHYSDLKRQTKITDAMQLGNLVHEAFAHSLQGDNTIDEMLKYIDTGFIYGDSIQDKAKAMVKYYGPLIGFGNPSSIRALQFEGRRMIEKRFDVDVSGFRILGYIDAIIEDRHGNTVLVDWKTRGQLLDGQQIAVDNQLYVYAYVAREILGIPIDKICQVQMKTTLPALPKLLKQKTKTMYTPKFDKFSKITYTAIEKKAVDDFTKFDRVEVNEPPALSKTLGATTRTTFIDECIRLGLSPVIEDYEHKFVDESEFLRMSYIDLDKVNLKTKQFLQWIDRIQRDTDMLPVNNSTICKWCQYRDLCLDNQ